MLQPSLFFFCFQHMPHRRHWMVEYHPWARKAHNLTDFLPHVRLVAMYHTVGAESFRLHKWAFIAALPRIRIENCTTCTETGPYAVLLSTVQNNHVRHHRFFPFPLCLYCLCHQPCLPFHAMEYVGLPLQYSSCFFSIQS